MKLTKMTKTEINIKLKIKKLQKHITLLKLNY